MQVFSNDNPERAFMQVFSNDDPDRARRIVAQAIVENERVRVVGPYSVFKAITALSNYDNLPMLTATFYTDNHISGIELCPQTSVATPLDQTSTASVVMNVKRTTNPKALALAILKSMETRTYPTINTIGAESTNIAVKALAIAGQKSNDDIIFTCKKKVYDTFTQQSLIVHGLSGAKS
jgi:stage V sporulation protein SpoVS